MYVILCCFQQILVTQTSEAQEGGTGGDQVSDTVARKSEDSRGEGYISDDSTNEDDDDDESTIAELGYDSLKSFCILKTQICFICLI